MAGRFILNSRRCMAAVFVLGLGFASVGVAAVQLRTEVVASGLQHPWAVAFVDGGRMLVTERSGTLRVVSSTGQVGAPVEGLPSIDAGGQGGLLDLITDRDFSRNRMTDRRFNRMRPSIAPRKRHQAG